MAKTRLLTSYGLLFGVFFFVNICVAIFLVIYMMYLAHVICKKWLLLPMRHRFFITYSIFFSVLYCVVVMVVFYQAYGYSEVQTLTTIVLWNYYVLSLQYAWGRLETAEGMGAGAGTNEIGREEGERRYFDSQYEVELSKGDGHPHPDLIDPSRPLQRLPGGGEQDDTGDNIEQMERIKMDGIKVFPATAWRQEERRTVNDFEAEEGKSGHFPALDPRSGAETGRGANERTIKVY